MGTREELQTLLETITPNVYFQPPPSVNMVYPCIVYRLDNIDTQHANNKPYLFQNRYAITVIDRSPISTLPDSVKVLPSAAFDRAYTASNLNHFVFRLYY